MWPENHLVVLSSELERLFDLDELKQLSEQLLGLDADEFGGVNAKASFVKALTQQCAASDRLPALCDALAAFRDDVDPQIIEMSRHGLFGFGDDLDSGDTLGPFLILRRLGRSRLGVVYAARREGDDVRLKVLHRSTTYERVGLQRFLTASRIIGSLGHRGLPHGVVAGEIDGRFYVAQTYVEGVTLAAKLAKTGPIYLEDARPLVRNILEPLAALHARRIAHGDLRPENILIDEDGGVTLLDAASHFLSAQQPAANGQSDRLGALGSAKTLAPEQIQGSLADARSDVYAFGGVLFEILTGRPLFTAKTPTEALMAHLVTEPQMASFVAPPGWVAPDVDVFIADLVRKSPDARPRGADVLLSQLDHLGMVASSPVGQIGPEELDALVQQLLNDPTDDQAEDGLVAAVRAGGNVSTIADTFRLAADLLDPEEGAFAKTTRHRLISRAAKLYELSLKQPESAEPLYAVIVKEDPSDSDATAALERLRRQLGKHDEIVEELLEKANVASSPLEKAQLLAEIGRIYNVELSDKDQALVAYTQAFCEQPTMANYAREVERLAGKSMQAWGEVMTSCVEASRGDLPRLAKHALLCQMARWYGQDIGRADLALGCYSAVLAEDAANDAALEGIASSYRRTQQWAELAHVLTMRADAPQTPGQTARDLRTEAAEIYGTKLGSVGLAQELFENVLAEDPSHEKASDALAAIYQANGESSKLVRLLERRAEALHGAEQLGTLCKIGELYEVYLNDIPEAIRRYRAVTAKDSKHSDALHGLDRCLSRAGDFDDLIDVLHLQIVAASTPRQKAHLWERVAAIWDEEFLNHQRSAEAWENVLDLDPYNDGALTQLVRHYTALDRYDNVVIILERHIQLLEKDAQRKVEKLLQLGRVLGEQLKLPERAILAYEQALSIDPQNPYALQALAGLRVQTGELEHALAALERLAREASTPAGKAEHYIRAAQLLEANGDPDGAIDHYKLAVDANPTDRTTSMILRAAYVGRGDHTAAAELLEQEIKNTAGESARAKLAGEMAALCHDRVKNVSRAESWAKIALDGDPTNMDALRVLGDIAYEEGRHLEAARHYEQVANRTDALPQMEAVRILTAYINCLLKNGQGKKAVEIGERLIKVAPDDPIALGLVAELMFDHGEPRDAFELHWHYIQQCRESLDREALAAALYRLGESARRVGDLHAAQPHLEEAAALDPSSNAPLKSLAEVFSAQKKWEQVVQTMYRQLDNESGEGKIKLLLEIGDLAARELKDPSYAAKSYLFALAEKPNDRKILMKLMQLYSEEKDWDRLIKVILKLADFVEDNKQKSKYLLTAGRISYREMGDVGRASQLLHRGLELDPDNVEILQEGLEVHNKAGNAEAMKQLLKRQVKSASDANQKAQMVTSLLSLAELYLRHFKRLDQAIAVYEGAQEVDNNVERRELLAQLYASDPTYYEKAVAAYAEILERDPFRPEAHRTLRKLHTDAKRPDPAWCCCQALSVLGQADADEERFYARMKSETGPRPKSCLTEQDFHSYVVDRHAEPLLTALFAVIQPAIAAVRTKPLRQLGYGPEHVVDPNQHQFAAAQTVPYAAEILGMQCPPLFQNPNDQGELSFLHTHPPSIVLGTSILGVALPPQAALFITARHLTYYRPGLYVRQLVPTTTGLKAWLFAAIRMMNPQFPVPGDIVGAVQEALGALTKGITGAQRDHLARVVSKLLQEGAALDLKKWTRAVDVTADRAGLLLADDLQTAVEMVRTSDPQSSVATIDERVEEIFRYSVSEQYFAARRTLGIAVDS